MLKRVKAVHAKALVHWYSDHWFFAMGRWTALFKKGRQNSELERPSLHPEFVVLTEQGFALRV